MVDLSNQLITVYAKELMQKGRVLGLVLGLIECDSMDDPQ